MSANTAARPKGGGSRRSRWLTRLLYAGVIVLVASVLAFNIFQPIKVLPRVSLAPGFAFTNQAGERKTSEDYRGKLTLYNFAYTRCGASCAPAATQMQALRQQLSQAGAPGLTFALVTISLDPERDTPAALQEYCAQFPAEPGNAVTWDWLTGDPQRTKYVVGGGFGVYYEKAADLSISFEPRVVLVDGWGIIRAEYRSATPDVKRIVRDVGYLTDEIRHSQGVGRFAYEAAHFFRCYH